MRFQLPSQQSDTLKLYWFALFLFTLTFLNLHSSCSAEVYGVFVGVEVYSGGQLAPLRFANEDATTLRKVFSDQGAEYDNLALLTTNRTTRKNHPTRANIVAALSLKALACGPADTFIVTMSGHGAQFPNTSGSFFCPEDADLSRPETLLSHAELHEILDGCLATNKMIFIDACRNEVRLRQKAGEEIELEPVTRQLPPPPPGIAAFYSCSPGEIAYEDPTLSHGLFFNFAIEGLRGAADFDGDKTIDLPELEKYVMKSTMAYAATRLSVRQNPQLVKTTSGLLPLSHLSGTPILGFGPTDAYSTKVNQQLGAEYTRIKVAFTFTKGSDSEGVLKKGDILLEVDGIAVLTTAQLKNLLGTYHVGDVVSCRVFRDGQPVELSVPLVKRPTPEERFRIYEAATREGDQDAQRYLRACYIQGSGVTADEDTYIAMLRKHANDGEPHAQLQLAQRLQTGQGVKVDRPEAIRLMRMAVKSGYALAETYLAVAVIQGKDVPKDIDYGVMLLRKAAEAGEDNAQYTLGKIYLTDQFKDSTQALYWLRRSAEQGNKKAHSTLGLLYRTGRVVPLDMEKSVSHYRQGALLGSQAAMDSYAVMLSKGMGVNKDAREAVRWFRAAALNGSGSAYRNLGLHFEFGANGIQKDLAEAARCYRKSCELKTTKDLEGVTSAKEMLIRVCRSLGESEEAAKRFDKALKWYQEAAELGDAESILSRGMIHYEYLKDFEAARKDFSLAAKNGDPFAMLGLSQIYENGQGVEKNERLAFDWLKKAAEKDLPLAQHQLGVRYFFKFEWENAEFWLKRGLASGKLSEENQKNAKLLLKRINSDKLPSGTR